MEGYGEAPCARRTAEREGVRHMAGVQQVRRQSRPHSGRDRPKVRAQHPEGAHLRGTALRDRQVGATLLCPSMFGKTDATVTGAVVDVGGRYVVRGLICDDGLWFSVKPDG